MKTLSSYNFTNFPVGKGFFNQYHCIFDIVDQNIIFVGLKDGSYAVYATDYDAVEKFESFDNLVEHYGKIDKEKEKLPLSVRKVIESIFLAKNNHNLDIDNVYASYL